jgi:hypothetical protein
MTWSYKAVVRVMAFVVLVLWMPSPAVGQDLDLGYMQEDGWVFGVAYVPSGDAAGAGGGGGYAASDWYPVVADACAAYGCDPAYVHSILMCESGGDPNAWHANPYGGADVGIMQINDATWGGIAYAGPVEQIWWAADMVANGYGHIWVCG